MIIYLLKMIACSAAFYALYHFFFSKEKMLVFNRYYLLGSFVASFIIPLITFTVYIPASPAPVEIYPINDTVVNMVAEPVVTKPDYLLWISLTIAVLITLILFIRFIKNLLCLRSSIVQSEKIKFENVQLVLVEKQTVPFSFMQNIFINKIEYEQGRVAPAVIAHEMAHIQQKHSWDILLVEILQIFTWFNPMIYFYKSAIKTNHEFLADEAVVQQTADRLHYQQLLLQMVYVNNNIPLASSFYFTTKKRLIMLQKTFKRKRAVWAGLAAVPLLALLVYFLSSKVYANVENPAPAVSILTDTLPEKPPPQPPYSKLAQDNLDKYSILFQFKDTKDNSIRVLPREEFKAIKRPEGVKNMIFIVSDYFVKQAVMIYPDNTRKIEDLSTPKARQEFKTKYGMDIGYKVYPKNEEQKLLRPLVVNNKTGERSISKEEMKEYEDLMKEMVVKKNGRTYYKFIDGKTQKAAEIYKRMSAQQRKMAIPFPPPPPPSPVKGSMTGVIKGNENIIRTRKGMPDDINYITFKFLKNSSTAEVKFKNGKTAKEDVSTIDKFVALENRYGVKFYHGNGKFVF